MLIAPFPQSMNTQMADVQLASQVYQVALSRTLYDHCYATRLKNISARSFGMFLSDQGHLLRPWFWNFYRIGWGKFPLRPKIRPY